MTACFSAPFPLRPMPVMRRNRCSGLNPNMLDPNHWSRKATIVGSSLAHSESAFMNTGARSMASAPLVSGLNTTPVVFVTRFSGVGLGMRRFSRRSTMPFFTPSVNGSLSQSSPLVP